MNAQVKIDQFLQHLTPVLHHEKLTLCLLDQAQLHRLLDHCVCVFREREGICALIPAGIADVEGLSSEGAFRQITLKFAPYQQQVPGLAATVVRELAEAGIHASVVSARAHEHILVPDSDASHALQTLYGISNRLQYS